MYFIYCRTPLHSELRIATSIIQCLFEARAQRKSTGRGQFGSPTHQDRRLAC